VDVTWVNDTSAVVLWQNNNLGKVELRVQRVSPTGPEGTPLMVAHVPAGPMGGFPMLAPVGDTLLLIWPDPKGAGIRGHILDG
jgi:hypothetical protein